jgi:hypothetical protein
VETYVILRSGGWRTSDELQAAAARSSDEGRRMPDDVRWIRSYVLAEASGELGTFRDGAYRDRTGPPACKPAR